VFNGFGTAGISAVDGNNAFVASPKASTSPSETHAALAVTQHAFGDIDLSMRFRTDKQLRTPTPNSWETAWALWHYSDTTHFYYLLLKPNGWELGKEDPAYPGAQRFLVTRGSPGYAVGTWHTVRIVQVGSTMTVYANGAKLASFTDNERPYTSGAIGMYTEDAQVTFSNVSAVAP
jgi:hypothetical protein